MAGGALAFGLDDIALATPVAVQRQVTVGRHQRRAPPLALLVHRTQHLRQAGLARRQARQGTLGQGRAAAFQQSRHLPLAGAAIDEFGQFGVQGDEFVEPQATAIATGVARRAALGFAQPQSRRTSRWASTPLRLEASRKGSTPMSRRRVMAPRALLVWRVESTR